MACARFAVRVSSASSRASSASANSSFALPGAALGSEALLHAGRTLAFFAAYLAVLVVFVRGWEGELPYELSGRGLKYKTRELKEEIQGTIEALIEANEELADRVDELKSRMDSLENRE